MTFAEIDRVNIVGGIIGAFFAAVFGEHWMLFAGFLFLNVCDYITGMYKSWVLQKSASVAGAKGILKKVSYWIVIAIAFWISAEFIELGQVVGVDLHFVLFFGWFTLASYIINEIRSILENLVEVGVEVPSFLIKGLDITRKIMEAKEKELSINAEDTSETDQPRGDSEEPQ